MVTRTTRPGSAPSAVTPPGRSTRTVSGSSVPSQRRLGPSETETTATRSGALLSVRAFVILTAAFVAGALTGTAAGLAAAYASDTAQLSIGVVAGSAAFLTSFLGTATGLHLLISNEPG